MVRQAEEWLAMGHPRLWRATVLWRSPEFPVCLLEPRQTSDGRWLWLLPVGARPLTTFSGEGLLPWNHPGFLSAFQTVGRMFPGEAICMTEVTPEQADRLAAEADRDALAVDYRPCEAVPEDYYAG